jgi:hypothetical protein
LFDGVLLQGTTVENWVQYGLGLPQYRDAFFNNAVTVLDFPLLLEQEALLEQELGVRSRLHRSQILRAMRNLILNVGDPPRPVRYVRHEADSDGGVVVAWEVPAEVQLSYLRQGGLSIYDRNQSQAPGSERSSHTLPFSNLLNMISTSDQTVP